MILPAAGSFGKCVMFGILGTLGRLKRKMLGSQQDGWLASWWLVVVSYSLSTRVQRDKKGEIEDTGGEDPTCPRELDATNQQEVV